MNGTFSYLSQAFKIYSKNAKSLITYSGIIALISLISSLLNSFVTSRVSLGALMVVFNLLFNALTLIISAIFIISLYQVIAKLVDGEKLLSLHDQLNQGIKRFWPFMLTSIILVLIVISGYILFIIPGIIFGVWYFAAGYISATKDVSPFTALDESKKAVTGRGWTVFGYFLIYLFVALILASVLILPIYYGLSQIMSAAYSENIATFIFLTIFLPMEYIVIGLIYKDLHESIIK